MEHHIRGTDLARGSDRARILGIAPIVRDIAHWNPVWNVWKFKDRDGRVFRRSHFRPRTLKELEREFQNLLVEKQEFPGNLLLNEGIDEALLLICGLGSPTAWNNANTRTGVGDSDTAAAATQTGLQAATNKYYMTMDASYPTSGTQKGTWKSTFATDVGNFAWKEITIVNAADDTGKNLNRKVQDMGTKTSDYAWVATLDITLA